jgi:uncharacterized protein
VDGKRRISMLNGNLVVRSTCDVSGKEFLSFLGTNKVPETIKELFKYAKKEGLKQELRMIPQETTNFCSDPTLKLKIEEDRDSFDYIYSLDDLSKFDGAKYAKFRTRIRKFEKSFDNKHRVEELDLRDKKHRESIAKIWCEWDSIKELYSQREEQSLVRLLNSSVFSDLIGTVVFIEDKPIAFSISQIINSKYAIGHFAKVDYQYPGIFPFLMKETAQALIRDKCELFNMEEDLGLPGLRKSKGAYCPIDFMRKYSIENKVSFMQKMVAMLQL